MAKSALEKIRRGAVRGVNFVIFFFFDTTKIKNRWEKYIKEKENHKKVFSENHAKISRTCGVETGLAGGRCLRQKRTSLNRQLFPKGTKWDIGR